MTRVNKSGLVSVFRGGIVAIVGLVPIVAIVAIGWTRIQSGKTAKKERRGILREFGWRGVRKFYGARRKAVSWSTHGWPGGILAENLSISKDGAKVR